MSVRVWSESDTLTPRVSKLRKEYYSFNERQYFRNMVMPFTTGKPWDVAWSPLNWAVVPEIYPFMDAFRDSLITCAKKVELPEGFWEMPIILRRAVFFREMMTKNIPIHILEGELIVGGQFNTAPSRCHKKSEHKKWKRKNKRWIKKARLINSLGIGNTGAIPGHLIPDYPRVLKEGFSGIKRDLENRTGGDDLKNECFFKALIECCDTAVEFARRYSEAARQIAESEQDEKRKGELLEIARICEKVPGEPAETFHEALQSLWFTHMLVMASEGYPGPGLSHGRFDQYMYPYYKRDMEEGIVDRDTAKELLSCYWIKHNYAYDYQGLVGSNQGINSGFGQLMTIGGLDERGEDASNELTLVILEVIEEMNMLEPKPNIRLHAKTPDDLLNRICEMIAKAQGAPFLLNFDENSIKGLRWQGLPEDRLWDYAPVGCLENTLQGDDRSGTVDVNVNLAKAMDLTFNRGRDPISGKRIGPRTKAPQKMRTYEDFKEAFEIQLKSMIDYVLDISDLADGIRAEFEPTPYLSAIVGGCAEKALDITAGGARHSYITVEGIAFATAADSLSAIKKTVFEDGRVSISELSEAVANDYEGHEVIRQTMLNKAPKYGNDDDFADSIAEYLNKTWTEYVWQKRTPVTKRRYRAGYLSWNYWISYAPTTAATPDGRRKGTHLSNGICPVDGASSKGPTAVSLSVGKVGLETAPNGASHTISLSPALLRDPEHIEKLKAFLRGYCEVGGTALQINVLDPEVLKEAQAKPEEYRNLLVRVTGYNAYFTMLGKEMQNEIIARESHNL